MNIIVAVKVVPDDQDVQVAADGSLDFSRAHQIVSTYDLNAIEAAAQLAKETGGTVTAVTVGPKKIDDSKLKKNILARGVDKLVMVADDACAGLDAHATALELAAAIKGAGDFDLVVCGDGSADDYAQQVDVQLACALGVPSVNAAAKVSVAGTTLTAVRALEDVTETVECDLPCVVAVTPDAAEPRIPGMKDILAAGKKPMDVAGAPEAPQPALTVVSEKAPEATPRGQHVADASDEGAVAAFAAALKAAL